MRASTGRHLALGILKPSLLFGVLLSLSVGTLCYVATANVIENDARARFKNHVRNSQYTINALIRSYTDVLRATTSLFQTSNDLRRDEFHRYVAGLDLEKHYPAIETVNFARWLVDEERDAFESAMRHGDTLVKGGQANFAIKPHSRRPTYSVLVFIEPNPLWAHTVGLDLQATSPLVKQALLGARDSGLLATSGTPIKAMTSRNRVGLGMRLPVYRANAPTDTVEQRRIAYIGSLGIAFSVEKLVHGVLDEMPIRAVRMSLFNHIVHGGPGDKAVDQLLFDSSATDANPRPPLNTQDADKFAEILPIDFNGRQWTAHFSVPKSKLYSGADGWFPWLAGLAGVVSTFLVYALFHTLTSSRRNAIRMAQEMTAELRESEAKLLRSNETLRRLAAHAENIKEGERKRIAREIHDDLGQNLLALRIEADMLSSRTGARHPRLHERALSTLRQIDTTIKSVRQIINDLRPNVLDLGLNAAVDWQIAEFRRRTGIDCELIENNHDIQVGDHCATALFRILQESLSNIARHAHATQVQVELRMDAEQISMIIGDDGIGLPGNIRHKSGSFGLVGIEERINILGGACSIRSVPNAGTTIAVSIPLSQEAASAPAALAASEAHTLGSAIV